MNWYYTLEITGVVLEERILLNIAIKHIGLNVQGSYLSTELQLDSNTDEEPRIACNRLIDCNEVVFVAR